MSPMTEEMSLRSLLTAGTERLREAGIEEAEYDARELLLFSFGLSWNRLLLSYETAAGTVSAEGCARYAAAIDRRAAHEPLQYITKEQNFCGLDLYVDPGVLIPRQDTEVLVEAVLQAPGKKETLLDLCTGSGCIALALKKLCGFREVTGADLSEEALRVARINAKRTGLAVSFVHSDLFEAFKGEGENARFDVITANPPYIPTADIAELTPEVRSFEPLSALDGAADGLFFYRLLAKECPAFLAPGGQVFFEIGYDQAEAVTGLLRDAGFYEVRCIRDLAGLDRVITGRI